MARLNDDLADEQRPMFRIDVHLVEIIVRDTRHDILRDGAEQSVRLQGIGASIAGKFCFDLVSVGLPIEIPQLGRRPVDEARQ